ncbi:hypothetical protein Tco_1533695 [Tanacetum coccineum]
MQATRDRQKSYADLKRKPMEFEVRDKVMLKVSPWKRVVRFGKRGKLNPSRAEFTNTFHVSNLKKCYADEPLAVPLDGLHFDDKLQFVEEPIEITDREVKRLKRSRFWKASKGKGLEFTGYAESRVLKVGFRGWNTVGRYTSNHEHHHKEDLKITLEDSWSDSNEDDHEEANEACLMAVGSQKAHRNHSPGFLECQYHKQ